MRFMPAVLLSAMLLTSCAMDPPYHNYAGNDAACISGGMANVIKFFSSGASHITVKEIDGVPSPGDGPFCIQPGDHRLGIVARAKDYQVAQQYIDVNLQPGQKYKLRGVLRGISIVVSLASIGAGGEENVVSSYSLLARTEAAPRYQPVFIPSK